MTHEADTTNFAMSLVDDAAEAAFLASVNKAKSNRRDQYAAASRTDHELRMSFGRWSVADKVEWHCATCTFLNQPLFLACEMCGTARPALESSDNYTDNFSSGNTYPSAGNTTSTSRNTDAEQQELLAQQEEEHRLRQLELDSAQRQQQEERLKQERIKEIMALQQGIFNKIREENEEAEEDDLESSFAWMDLEDTLPLKELPSGRPSMTECGGIGAYKKAPEDSNRTLTTAASSYSNSSQFSLDISGGSQNSYHSRRSTRNSSSALPDQFLSSLKSDESFKGSLHRGSLQRQKPPGAGSSRGVVDFGALKAAVEGSSVRSLPLGFALGDSARSLGVGSSHSTHSMPSAYGISGESTHSLDAVSTHSAPSFHLEIPSPTSRRHGSVSALQAVSEGSKELICQEDHSLSPPNSPVGAMSVTGPPRLKSFKNTIFDDDGDDNNNGKPEPDQFDDDDDPKPEESLYASGSHSKGTPREKSCSSLRTSLHRREGARTIKPPTLIPEEMRKALTDNDPIFSRNLYAGRRHSSCSKKNSKARSPSPKGGKTEKEKAVHNKGVHIPILNRMLRKKSIATAAKHQQTN